MKAGRFLVGMAVISLCMLAPAAWAISVDVCVNPTTDARFDSTGTFFTGSAPIYPKGTIAESSSAIDCSKITTTPIGTFFTVGGLVSGLPSSADNDVAMVTWHFRIGTRAFDTAGPVESVKPGQTYPQTVIGAVPNIPFLFLNGGAATVTALDPTGFVFEITVNGGNGQ